MELELEFEGSIVERQELLNGTQIVSLEGADSTGQWTLSGLVAWNIGLVANTGEGDITLSRGDGAEIFGSLLAGDVVEVASADAEPLAEYALHLQYEIDGGTGEFEGVSGTCEAVGALGAAQFRGRWVLSLRLAPNN